MQLFHLRILGYVLVSWGLAPRTFFLKKLLWVSQGVVVSNLATFGNFWQPVATFYNFWHTSAIIIFNPTSNFKKDKKKSWQHLELVSKSYNFFCWFFQFSTFREFCRFEYICTHQLNSTLYLQVQVQSTRHFHRQRIQRPNSKVICLYTVHCTLYSQSANTTWTDLNRADTTPYLAAWKKLVQSHSPGKMFVQL